MQDGETKREKDRSYFACTLVMFLWLKKCDKLNLIAYFYPKLSLTHFRGDKDMISVKLAIGINPLKCDKC